MKHILIPLALIATPLAAQDNAEVALAKNVLNQLQPPSFANNREYCGYLYLDTNGDLTASDAVAGEESSCLPPEIPQEFVIVASYHTHGKFDLDVPAEFPSVGDIEGDEAEGINGYVATPGGRLWFVDTTDMEVSQICSIGCLTQDPAFEAGLDGDIAISYTYDELLELEGM